MQGTDDAIMIQVEETEVIGLDWLDRMGMG